MMASAAASEEPELTPREATASFAPAVSLLMGRRSPMRPVEHTSTSPAETPSRSATSSADSCVSWKPGAPVQALAPPELSRTASARPSLMTCWLHSTGAAAKRLLVKTAAACLTGPSLTTRATSFLPSMALIPARTPAARKPRGKVTPWVVMPSIWWIVSVTVRVLPGADLRFREARGQCSWIGWHRRRCPWLGCR